MTLDASKSIEQKPSLYEALLSFGTTMDGAIDICKDEASARFLVGTSFRILAQDLRLAFGDIDASSVSTEADEAPFIHVEYGEAAASPFLDTPQIPVMAKPMQALIPVLEAEAELLLNGSNREKPLEQAYFKLREHQEQFKISAEVVETLTAYIEPLKNKRFEQIATTAENVQSFADAVAATANLERMTGASQIASGPNQALIAKAVSTALKRAA